MIKIICINKHSKKAFTSFFFLVLLTVLITETITSYKLITNLGTAKANTEVFLQYSNKEIILKNKIVSTINTQIATITDPIMLQYYFLNLRSNLNTFTTTENILIQIVSISDTVYRLTIKAKLFSTTYYDMEFKYYIELYRASDRIYKVRIRGVIM